MARPVLRLPPAGAARGGVVPHKHVKTGAAVAPCKKTENEVRVCTPGKKATRDVQAPDHAISRLAIYPQGWLVVAAPTQQQDVQHVRGAAPTKVHGGVLAGLGRVHGGGG